MKLYTAVITCKKKSAWPGPLPADHVYTFVHAIAADGDQAAHIQLESTFPWTFYKHIKINWTCIGEKV